MDANGPLARLKKLLFNKETIQTVSQWSREVSELTAESLFASLFALYHTVRNLKLCRNNGASIKFYYVCILRESIVMTRVT